MSRPIRLEYEGAVYHVTARGNAGQGIYLETGGIVGIGPKKWSRETKQRHQKQMTVRTLLAQDQTESEADTLVASSPEVSRGNEFRATGRIHFEDQYLGE